MSLNWWKWHYELQKASRCIVGEAYGYSSQYTHGCGKCNRIGCKFLYYFTLNLRGKLESNKQDFVKHWNEKHINLNTHFSFVNYLSPLLKYLTYNTIAIEDRSM